MRNCYSAVTKHPGAPVRVRLVIAAAAALTAQGFMMLLGWEGATGMRVHLCLVQIIEFDLATGSAPGQAGAVGA